MKLDLPRTIPPTRPLQNRGRGTDKNKKCRIVHGFRIKPPKIQGDRWTVQARGNGGKWVTQITTQSETFADEWIASRSPRTNPK